MSAINPYSCTRPGNLFVGYEELRELLLEGFRDGDSFATLSGRRCGKTSLLLQLEKDLLTQDLSPFVPLPRFLDMQAFGTLTPVSLFEALYVCVTQDVDAPAWSPRQTANVYQDFLRHLDTAKPLLDQQHGSNWLIILLIDELDAAVSALEDDQFFQNVRNLLTVSRFHHHFRLVATGVNDLAELISSGTSPLNNLNNQYLRILTNEEAGELIQRGFPQGLPAELEQSLLQRTGGHPYLLQGLLAKLWRDQAKGEPLDESCLSKAERGFQREHNDLYRWLQAFSPAEHAVYQLLADTPDRKIDTDRLRRLLPAHLAPQMDDALTVLSYHGVIDDSDPEALSIAGTLFRDWYQRNQPSQDGEPSPLRLFLSYSHADEDFLRELETHLTPLRRQSIIDDWHDRKIPPGSAWSGQIDQHLEGADIILLLISADFLASQYCYEIEMQRALERHEAEEACVIPIILRSADWTDMPFAELQALPRDGKPVKSWADRDEAWTDVVQGLKQIAKQLRQDSSE